MMNNFNIKLISNNKVVLLELEGFSPEIFIPVIKQNRITLENFIESRRCVEDENSILNRLKVKKIPVKRSKAIENKTSILSPPDIARRCIQSRENKSPSPIIIENESLQSPVNKAFCLKDDNYKVIRLFRSHTENSPKKPAKLVSLSKATTPFKELSNRIIDKELPKLTPICNKTPPLLNPDSNFESPIQMRDLKHYSKKNIKLKSPPKTITKWRKCITPVRTYSRKKCKPTKTNETKLSQPATPRVVPIEEITLPDYLRNSTDGIEGNAFLVVKKRKLIHDDAINICAGNFKKQLTDTMDLKQGNLFLPKVKIDFQNSIRGRSYELLTNLCRHRNVSKSLTEMFNSRCVKKFCPTRHNYIKLIGTVPQLESKNNSSNNERLNYFKPRKLKI